MLLKRLIKKYLIWMLISYFLICILVYTFFLTPQKRVIDEYRKQKDVIEYTYMKIASSPSFLNSLSEAVTLATIKTDDFFWLDRDVDRGLALYNYLYTLANKTNVELLEVIVDEKTSSSTKDSREEKLYYRWKVKLTGFFPDIVYFIDQVENSRKFLIVKEIYIRREQFSEQQGVIYEITLLGLKSNTGNGENEKAQ